MTPPLKLPWDYSNPVPGNAVPNVPTPEGRVCGQQLASWVDELETDQRKQFPNMRPRCDDCALRAGTLPNGCLSTLGDLVKAVAENDVFYCHKGVVDDREPKAMCAGFAILLGAPRFRDGPEKDPPMTVLRRMTPEERRARHDLVWQNYLDGKTVTLDEFQARLLAKRAALVADETRGMLE